MWSMKLRLVTAAVACLMFTRMQTTVSPIIHDKGMHLGEGLNKRQRKITLSRDLHLLYCAYASRVYKKALTSPLLT